MQSLSLYHNRTIVREPVIQEAKIRKISLRDILIAKEYQADLLEWFDTRPINAETRRYFKRSKFSKIFKNFGIYYSKVSRRIEIYRYRFNHFGQLEMKYL